VDFLSTLILARQTANTTRNISRKGAKHVLSDVEGAAKKFNFRTWRPFDFAQDRLGASKSPFWIATLHRKICASRETFKL